MDQPAAVRTHRPALGALLLLGLFAGALALSATAQGAPTDLDPRIEHWIQYWTGHVERWRHEGQVCLWLTLTAGGLGIAVGALQLMRQKWLQAALFCAGAAISILTLVTNTRYSSDYRGYQRLVATADRLVQKMRDVGSSYTNDEERRFAVNQVLRIHDELSKLEDAFLQGSAPLPQTTPGHSSSRSAFDRIAASLLPIAYAATAQGSCASHARSDANALYFVGLGSEASLERARQLSRQSADQLLLDDLQAQVAGSPIDPDGLARFVAQVASVEDVCYERPTSDKPEYRVFTVLRLPRSALDAAAPLYGAREQVAVPTEIVQALTKVAPSSVSYAIARQDTYDRLAQAARRDVPAAALQDYEDGRRARQAHDCQGAIASLHKALRAKPEFFLALFNLGLAEEACGNTSEAASAYGRAAAVADRQVVKDASFRNTYGWFLYRQKDYAAAAGEFEKALAIEPKHPLAGKNLAAAQAAENRR